MVRQGVAVLPQISGVVAVGLIGAVAGRSGLSEAPGQALIRDAGQVFHRVGDFARGTALGRKFGEFLGKAKLGEFGILTVAHGGRDLDMGARHQGVKGQGGKLILRQKRVTQGTVVVRGTVEPVEIGFEAGDKGAMGDQGGEDHRLAQVFLDIARGRAKEPAL